MFYWDFGGIYLVLTDEEEQQLVRQFANGNATKVIAYDTNARTRKEFERRISSYLRDLYTTAPDDFLKKFVYREAHGVEAQKLFPCYLDAYGRATRLATFGRYLAESVNGLVGTVIHARADEVYYVSLLDRRRFRWMGYKVTGEISFPATSIQRLNGSVDNFFLTTVGSSIFFGRECIRIVLP
jgi:hypothetical protein